MTIPIYSEGRLVAVIDAVQGPRIRYDDAWRDVEEPFPISLSMPLSRQEHGPEVATPWLMNLLPEGDPLRAMTQALGVARDDVLGLIVATGRDLAGALTIAPAEDPAAAGYRAVESPAELERIIAELPAKPFMVGEDGVSMSLAGAQEKLPVALIADAIAIPVNGAPSTHILKPDNARLPGSVQNEALGMVLARRCGLNVAPVSTGHAGVRSYLLVERYDRIVRENKVQRIHQEDLCQALGLPPAVKYQYNGTGVRGPSVADMFQVVRDHMTAVDINALLDAFIFNIAIGNVDAHAKNYSILLRPRQPALAPLYDLMSGLVWANITPNYAQDVGGQRGGRHIYARHWRRMAKDCGLSPPGVLRRVDAVTTRLLAELSSAAEEVAAMTAGPGPLLASFAAAIGDRARLIQANAERSDEPDGLQEGAPPMVTARV